MRFSILAPLVLLTGSASAAADCERDDPITADQLLVVAPSSKSCDGVASHADECITAAKILPHFEKGFEQYEITEIGNKAALIALTAVESAEFRYFRNYFGKSGSPQPGQGTRAQLKYNFLYELAGDALPEEKFEKVDPDANPDVANKQRDIVGKNEEVSASAAAWFYHKHCATLVGDWAGANVDEQWVKYYNCVNSGGEKNSGTEVPENYQDKWELAKQAFNLQ